MVYWHNTKSMFVNSVDNENIKEKNPSTHTYKKINVILGCPTDTDIQPLLHSNLHLEIGSLKSVVSKHLLTTLMRSYLMSGYSHMAHFFTLVKSCLKVGAVSVEHWIHSCRLNFRRLHRFGISTVSSTQFRTYYRCGGQGVRESAPHAVCSGFECWRRCHHSHLMVQTTSHNELHSFSL